MPTRKEINSYYDGQGHLHPLTQVIGDVARVFSGAGFEIAEGTEAETEYYNFDALNVPKDHPARDMQDTFWLQSNQQFPISNSQFPKGDNKGQHAESQKLLLRTHTSAVQVRYMETHTPPFKLIIPGKVFRHEATDATHEAQFYQVEGLAVGKDITLADLKGTLELFFKNMFGGDAEIRLRPGYFPFVEPGVEIDMRCYRCSGGCSTCKGSGWIEVLGAGMVHPNVLNAAGIDPRVWRGFAFGVGVDRLAMIKYGIDDVRLLYNGDLRVINQF